MTDKECGCSKLVSFTGDPRAALDWARGELWAIYQALKRLHCNGAELLRAFDRPKIARHNNPAERRCRDTFASLKKMCRKHGISFWAYLRDRLTGANTIAWLPTTIFGIDGEPAPPNRAYPADGP